jgi:DNA-binding IclR family transcriptional regulator
VLLAWSGSHGEGPREAAPPGQHGDGELAQIRDRGWAASVAEREPGVASVSAPVFRAGVLLAALCVSGPVSRLSETPGRRLSQPVTEAAAQLSALLTEPDSEPATAVLPRLEAGA